MHANHTWLNGIYISWRIAQSLNVSKYWTLTDVKCPVVKCLKIWNINHRIIVYCKSQYCINLNRRHHRINAAIELTLTSTLYFFINAAPELMLQCSSNRWNVELKIYTVLLKMKKHYQIKTTRLILIL